ncbi:protein-lysine N-methyltransferase EFM1 [Henckelia pumila]|uniref:protein-lysine N-methyltransferase EFM1 n=1 Tax=Henckelia pumila TaxID=405737 RepID=UPI003C6E360D
MPSTMETSSEEAKLELFLQWLKVNGVELRGCDIKYCGSDKGFGVFSSDVAPDGILLVVPLDLAITPMRVLQDPLLGPECRAMLDEGGVDDRLLIMLFLIVERLRKNSHWKPYIDMLPDTFGNPLWFSEDDLLELKGTTLRRATEMQKKNLKSLFEGKVKKLVEKLLAHDGNSGSFGSEVRFEDFLWANSIFWARALNIPFPRSYVFPRVSEEQDSTSSIRPDAPSEHVSVEKLVNIESGKNLQVNDSASQVSTVTSNLEGENLWVEGLVPGIDFCNHDFKAAATWEVDGTGSTTGIPFSMYLLSVGKNNSQVENEISISYGNKGNEELLYLYGFVIKDNPDDYLMIHYPLEAISNVPFSEAKGQLLEVQKCELRCLLPRSLLNNGFFPESSSGEANSKGMDGRGCNYSWSGHRKIPSYASKLVFPEDFLSALRTIAMRENELYEVSSFLEEVVASREDKQPSEMDVRAAIWEACGDSGALQILVDLLNMKMLELEEGSSTEESDTELLKVDGIRNIPKTKESGSVDSLSMSTNRWSSIVYRRGQKQLTRRFLKEAEHALELALSEGN